MAISWKLTDDIGVYKHLSTLDEIKAGAKAGANAGDHERHPKDGIAKPGIPRKLTASADRFTATESEAEAL